MSEPLIKVDECKYGHPLAGANLRIAQKKRTKADGTTRIQNERVCRLCHARNLKAAQKRKKMDNYYAEL